MSYWLLSFFLLYVLVEITAQQHVDVTIKVKGDSTIAETDDNFVCATIDWWPAGKCNYNQCPWGESSVLNLVWFSVYSCLWLYFSSNLDKYFWCWMEDNTFVCFLFWLAAGFKSSSSSKSYRRYVLLTPALNFCFLRILAIFNISFLYDGIVIIQKGRLSYQPTGFHGFMDRPSIAHSCLDCD